MRNNEFWLSVETDADRRPNRLSVGPIRVALLFGTMAVAMALFLPPMVSGAADERKSTYLANLGVDEITTGSIGTTGPRRYIIRRSILQDPGEACVLYDDGRTFGDC